MTDFKNINYLRSGNARQQAAYAELTAFGVFEHLAAYNPILCGTIPIDIDLPNSDLDIICECRNLEAFQKLLQSLYGENDNFNISIKKYYGLNSIITSFKGINFDFEIFGQDLPVVEQNAYLHMVIEHRILIDSGPEFRKEILELKRKGYKTEPAFAKLLGLAGDPYISLLEFKL